MAASELLSSVQTKVKILPYGIPKHRLLVHCTRPVPSMRAKSLDELRSHDGHAAATLRRPLRRPLHNAGRYAGRYTTPAATPAATQRRPLHYAGRYAGLYTTIATLAGGHAEAPGPPLLERAITCVAVDCWRWLVRGCAKA
jgi:hypothetical protein